MTPPEPHPSHQGWRLSSTVRAGEAAGDAAGRAFGHAESRAATLAALLRRQARQRFGGADAAGQDLLDELGRAHAGDLLEDLSERLLDADGWAGWLAGCQVPPAPAYPEYAKNLEINLEPDQPSIDSLMKVGWKAGGEGIILIRMQKWYQPDLDKILFHESERLDRLHGHRPVIAVVLMWPMADGPGITGSYRGRDRRGRPRTVTYTIRRAWELPPEDALKSPGTMMLAPLGKNAREKMPEIIRRIDEGLKSPAVDQRTREAVWITTYWAMGIVCTEEEAHAALGDRLAIVQSTPDYLSAKGRAFQAGYEQGGKAGPVAAARALIVRQGRRRFGARPEAEEALAGIDDLGRLEAMAGQVLSAADWPALLASGEARPAAKCGG